LDIAVVGHNIVRHDGQGRAALELVRELARRGHRLTVYAHRLDPEVAELVNFHPLGVVPGPQLVDDLTTLVRATLLVRGGRHAVTCILGPTALPSRPFVFYCHFSHRAWRRTWTATTRPSLGHRAHAVVAAWLENAVARRATTVLATTPEVGADVAGSCGTPVDVAPPGIDPGENEPARGDDRRRARAALGLSDDDETVVFLGGFATGRKGLEPLIEAVAKGPEHLIVAGEGDPSAVAARVAELGIGSRVRLLGFVPSGEILDAADVVAVPSFYEPFSLVGLEAAQRALPLVIARSAGVAAHLGEAAVVIDDPADPGQIRAALDVLSDPGERARRGGKGPAAAALLAWDKVIGPAADSVERAAARP
jgi:glycosyltransferase involved in cell wall biosynthesis